MSPALQDIPTEPRRRRDRGFALLLVMLVLTVAATALALSARRQGLLALQALHARRDCQLRWGMLSCRTLALARADRILERAGLQEDVPPVEAVMTLALGDVTFDLVVGDEQAKANVNRMAEEVSLPELADRVEALLGGPARVAVHLAPLTDPADPKDQAAPAQRYRTLDQVLRYDSPAALFGPTAAEGSAVRGRLTCWGDGRLNVRTASREAFDAIVGDILDDTDITALLAACRGDESTGLDAALASLGLDEDPLSRARSRLTDQSRCRSVWIRADDGFRRHYRLYVETATADGGPDTMLFVWHRS